MQKSEPRLIHKKLKNYTAVTHNACVTQVYRHGSAREWERPYVDQLLNGNSHTWISSRKFSFDHHMQPISYRADQCILRAGKFRIHIECMDGEIDCFFRHNVLFNTGDRSSLTQAHDDVSRPCRRDKEQISVVADHTLHVECPFTLICSRT